MAGFAPNMQTPPVAAFLLFYIVLLGVLIVKHRNRSRPIPITMLTLGFLMAGLLYGLSHLSLHPNQFHRFYDQHVTVTGVVKDSPVFLNGKWRYIVKAERVLTGSGENVELEDRIQISDSRKIEPIPRYGDRIQIRGLLLEPTPQRNPGGYDDQQYLARKGIHARMSVKFANQIEKIGQETSLYGITVSPLRDHAWNTLYKLFPPGEAELAGGIVLGFKSDLPGEWETAFETLSVTHILAASGFNVGLISAALFYLFKLFRMPKGMAGAIVILTIVIYTLASGAGPSVVRAGIMAILILIGASLGRQADMLTTVATAALLSALWNPGVVFDIGFLLSFITTIGLILLTPRWMPFLPGPGWFRSALAACLAAQIASTPILVYHFNQISPFSLLANLYIMPLTFLLVPLGFGMLVLGMAHPWLALPFVGLYRFLMLLLVKPVVWLSEATRQWTLSVSSPPLWGVALFYAGLLFLLYRNRISKFTTSRRFVRNGIGLLAILLVAAALLWLKPSKELRVTFLDVGQGDSALIETPSGMTILVDGGGIPSYFESDFDVGERIVLPFLRHRGVGTLDYVIATHADEDHVRGLLAILKHVKVRNLIVSGYPDDSPFYQEILETARSRGTPIYQAQAGIGWQLEPGVAWRFLNPAVFHQGTRSDSNSNSVVFQLEFGSRRFLFTGDIEGETEPDILPFVQPVDVLKVAHHGSHYSTTPEFLAKVRPRYAIISAGKRNVYHHPHRDVLNRLAGVGAQVYRTDRHGAVTVTTDGNKLQIRTAIADSQPNFR
ncbi:DNA internalization-related competence protein ComEC/Rec2 [Effusibacillus lacus]